MKRSITALIAGSLLTVSFAVFAGPGAIEGVQKQPVNFSAIAMFMVFVLATLGITKGNSYAMDIFHAERHSTGSNFRIDTTIGCFVPQ